MSITINVKNHPGNAVLDGKHNDGGPLDIPAGTGKYATISVTVVANQDLSWLSLHRELSGTQPTDIGSDLHVEFVDSHGLVRAVADNDRLFGSNEPIIRYDTATKDQSGTVTQVQPGTYQFRIFSNSGRAYHGLVFGVQQTPPHA